MTSRRQLWLVLALRSCLFVLGALAIVAGAWARLSPLISTALWVLAIVLLACLPSSLVYRAVMRALHVPRQPPHSLVRSGASLTSDRAPGPALALEVRDDPGPLHRARRS